VLALANQDPDMTWLDRQMPPAARRWELPVICFLAWLGFVAIPLSSGMLGLSWDALNHHIYLGWTAQEPRFDRDLFAAAGQSYQYPYLYWPVYKLAAAGWSGASAGVVLATLHLIVVPPVWLLARVCMPGQTVFDALMRGIALALAFMTGVVLAQFDSTSNDLLAGAPLAWAVALALTPMDSARPAWLTPARSVGLSGLLAGISVAFKLSNGPLVLATMPVAWLLATPGGVARRIALAALGCALTLLGCAIAYAPWGVALWHQFGNPIYPFYDPLFDPLRSALGWSR
jgi:hypothetical protein